jgi:hypothetical protein
LPVGPHVIVGTNWGPLVMRDSERSARLCTVIPRQELVPGTADQGERVVAIYWGSSGHRFSALVCVDCGDSWLVPRRVSQPLCATGSGSSLLGAKRAAVSPHRPSDRQIAR